MNENGINYTALESARAFHESDARVKAAWGPVGSGKSSAACLEFFFQCSESPIPVRGIVVRSSYRELHDTTRQTFAEWFGPIMTYRERDETAVITIGKLQHELLFRSIQKPEDTSKLLSLEVSFAWMEECVPAFMTNGIMGAGLPKGVMDILLMRLRQKGAHRYTLILTANAPSKSHWFYKYLIAPSTETLEKKGWASFFQPPGENNANLPAGYYDELRSHLDPDLVRRFIEGEVLTAYDGEAVFPECSEKLHVVDGPIKPVPYVGLAIGTDWGNVVSASIITQLTPMGRWLVLREVISQNTAADQHIEELKAVIADEFAGHEITRCVGDPAGNARAQTDSKTCFQIAESKGLSYETGAIDFQTRKEAIKQRLTRNVQGEAAMQISRDGCPTFAEGILGAYRYPRSSDGRVGYRPLKNLFSHPLDAGQYLASRLFKIWTPADPEYYQPHGDYIRLPPLDPFRPVQKRRMQSEDGESWLSN